MDTGTLKRAISCVAVLAWASSLPAGADPLLEGQVSLPSGDRVPGARVMLFDLVEFRLLARTATDETGRFTLSLEAVQEGSPLPERFSLGQNYPNPFNPSTIIPYQLPASARVRLEVFNLLGQRIATLVDGEQPAGLHIARWDGTDAVGRAVGAGVYLYRLQSGQTVATERMVLVDGQAGIPAPGMANGGAAPALEPPGTATYIHGLTVSGPGLVPYVDAAFRVETGMGTMDLVVQETGIAPRERLPRVASWATWTTTAGSISWTPCWWPPTSRTTPSPCPTMGISPRQT